MDLQSGVFLPFFLISIPILLAIIDLAGIGKSTSAMTQRSGGGFDDRNAVRPAMPRAAL